MFLPLILPHIAEKGHTALGENLQAAKKPQFSEGDCTDATDEPLLPHFHPSEEWMPSIQNAHTQGSYNAPVTQICVVH